jgi:hypothetical protein
LKSFWNSNRFTFPTSTSTGIKTKIQVSQMTAHCLTKAGKGHWLTLREDQVKAKGKGIPTTYWLCITKMKSIGSDVTSSTGHNGSRNVEWLDDPESSYQHQRQQQLESKLC